MLLLTRKNILTKFQISQFFFQRCDDFYNYACGSYNHYTKLPNNDTFKWDEMDIMRLKVEQELFLTVNTTFGDESEVMKIPKKLYKACMDLGI